jgi:ABC-type lipoprotein export system ATPase subunit
MIELREVSRIFTVGGQEVRAMDRVSLTIAPGEYLSIMGPSGSGKSTLLNILGLLDTPNSGTYLLKGQDVTSLDDAALAATRNRTIGFIFQFFHLIPRLTAQQNIELPSAACRREPPGTDRTQPAPDRGLRPGRPAPPPAGRTLRRPAAAGRHRPGGDQQTLGPACRRTHRQP